MADSKSRAAMRKALNEFLSYDSKSVVMRDESLVVMGVVGRAVHRVTWKYMDNHANNVYRAVPQTTITTSRNKLQIDDLVQSSSSLHHRLHPK